MSTLTNFDICEDALRKIGVLGIGVTATAEEMETARRGLNRMLKAWQARGLDLWLKAAQSVPLTTAAIYTLDPVRPLHILSCRLNRAGVETPMQELTRDEYDAIPLKAAKGLPNGFHYDRQREDARLLIWPSLAVVNGETLEITYTREIEDVTLTGEADVPGEWYDAVVYGLAARLADDFAVNAPNIIARAEDELDRALAFDREGSVFFAGPYA